MLPHAASVLAEEPLVGAAVGSYVTDLGTMLSTSIEDALSRPPLAEHFGRTNLVFTSPPFPLTRQKRYGNKTGQEYLEWLGRLAPRLAELLSPKGSLVIEIRNAWDR